jgi:hypothetical protein
MPAFKRFGFACFHKHPVPRFEYRRESWIFEVRAGRKELASFTLMIDER